MAQTYSPGKHGKNALTGKGQMPKAPGNAGMGNSSHTPKIGKPTPGEPGSLNQQKPQ